MKHGMKQQLVIQLLRILLFTNLSHILDLIWDYSLLIRIRIQLILESISTLPRTITLLYNLELYRDKLLRPFYFWNNTFYGLWSCLNKFSIFSLLNTIASLPSPKGVGVWGKSLMQGPNQGIVWHSTYYKHLYPSSEVQAFLNTMGRFQFPYNLSRSNPNLKKNRSDSAMKEEMPSAELNPLLVMTGMKC